MVQLRHKIRRPDDRPCNQLREEGHIKSKIEHILHRFDLPPVNIDGVTHGLEGEEGDTYRQEDFLPDEIGADDIVELEREVIVNLHFYACDLREKIGKEIGVFEVNENEEVDHYAQSQPRLLLPACVCFINPIANEEIGKGGNQQNDEVKSTGLVVEKEADRK